MHLVSFLSIIIVVIIYSGILYKWWSRATIYGDKLEKPDIAIATFLSLVVTCLLIMVLVGLWQLTQ